MNKSEIEFANEQTNKMNDLISRKALINTIETACDESKPLDVLIRNVSVAAIKKAPAVDAELVVHGWWVKPTVIDGRGFNIPHCSICNGVPCGVDEHTNYCPNCGAKMDEVSE